MAELDKKLYIKKDSVEQTVTLYTTSEEAGEDYAYIKVDGTQAYIPLGEVDDSRATIGKIQKSSGSQFSILATAKISYHKDSYTNAGTYTWTCPADVTKVKVTVAGGGGGGVAFKLTGLLAYTGNAPGGSGAMVLSTIPVISGHTYQVIVGGGGNPLVRISNRISPEKASDGSPSSFHTLSASGGGGGEIQGKSPAYKCVAGTSYGSGALGGTAWDVGANAGNTGWVNVEYGGDI
ncbi:glycine-rich domain-containing protein [Megasphaera sp.]|uniref:glycine-rich domain-containing protein n=1 Tax=Megasphaera sp. TaxID=2023260 RepID=UPI003078C947